MKIENTSSLDMQFLSEAGETITTTVQSSTVSAQNLTISFGKVLTGPEFIAEGNEGEITLTLSNNSDIEITAVNVKSTINAGAEFVAGSVMVNEESNPDASVVDGFDLAAAIAPATETIVKFKVKAASPVVEEFVTLAGALIYKITDPTEGELQFEENSNSLDIQVVSADLTITNVANHAYVIKGQTLHYTITIANGATTEKTNLMFKNPIPVGTTFVEASVKVNDAEQAEFNPETGFALETLAVSTEAKVEFDVLVE